MSKKSLKVESIKEWVHRLGVSLSQPEMSAKIAEAFKRSELFAEKLKKSRIIYRDVLV